MTEIRHHEHFKARHSQTGERAVPLKLVIFLSLFAMLFSGCDVPRVEHAHQPHEIIATRPVSEDVVIRHQFVCQIRSRRHIDVRALEQGYLEEIPIKEGQEVKEGDVLFTVIPTLYKSRLEAEKAAAHAVRLQYNYSKKLFEQKVLAENAVTLLKTKLDKAEADVKRVEAELDFSTVRAPFDGLIDRLRTQQGTLIDQGEVLTRLSDNSVMWVYFNVPETRYLAYMRNKSERASDQKIELMLANNTKFNQPGTIGAIEADFDNSTGNIPFRADFPNPDHLLRNGQTGTIWISHVEPHALLIPQRATFEELSKRYVYVIGDDNVAHRREIEIQEELEDIFLIKKGLSVDDKILLEGLRQVHDGETVQYVERAPDEVLRTLKYHAE